ncbi:MAG TPA: DUF4382 domain-containing protein [Candidatus Acidoferrales bacterium]|nr:DUF4382 domain-containing protein [Candidatus Acidoferrales bacterium]
MNPTCPAGNSTGTVAVTFGSSLAASGPAPLRTPHLFVTLRGIDALAAPIPGDDGPSWQELAPQLTDRPVQVDLMAPAAGSCESGPLGSLAVPAGVYRQLRLRLVPDAPRTTAALVNESVCGADVFSCFIPPDGTTEPLTWDDPTEVVIPSDRLTDGLIRVLPETTVHVSIALDPRSSLVLTPGRALRLIPSFSASVHSECSPTD